MKTRSNSPSSPFTVSSAGPTWRVIFEPWAERSKYRCANAARSGSSSHASIRPPSGSAAAIASAEWPLNVPISSTRCGRPNQTSSSRNRPATGPVSICVMPSSVAVSADSSASRSSCGEESSSTYRSMRGSTTSTRLTYRHPTLRRTAMPGLWSRFMLIFKSKASKALDRAENPNETLDYSYEKQLEQLQNVKRGIADVTTAKKRLELQYTSMQQQVDKLDGQARDALKANREDLAREALTRKAAVEGQLQDIMSQGQQLEAQQQKLIEGERTLQAKVESFRTQKEVIKAQYSAAEAQVRISEAASGIGEEMADVGLAIQRAKDKTDQMQARANAIDELTTAGALDDFSSGGDDIDRQLAQISQSSQVDDELAKMKAQIGQGSGTPKQLEGDEAP